MPVLTRAIVGKDPLTEDAGVPDQVGQIIYSVDGATFTVEQPLTSDAGWLVNDEGHLLVVG